MDNMIFFASSDCMKILSDFDVGNNPREFAFFNIIGQNVKVEILMNK